MPSRKYSPSNPRTKQRALLGMEMFENRQLLATIVSNEAEFISALANGDACIELASDIGLTGTPLHISAPTSINGMDFTIDGGKQSRVFTIDNGDDLASSIDVELVDLNIVGGFAEDGGGAILNYESLTIRRSIVTGNEATNLDAPSLSSGGAIRTFGDLTITQSTFSSNTSYWNGGGIYATGERSSRLSLEVRNSTITGNATRSAGGGIATQYADIILYQVTAYQNSSLFYGGFLFDYGSYELGESQLLINRSTIAYNSSDFNFGGVYSSGTADIRNSIISGNSAKVFRDIHSNYGEVSYSMLSESNPAANIGPGTLVGTYALLGPLQDNGGLTDTLYPVSYSQAIDAADPNDGLGFDQRGVARTSGGFRMDMGSVEVIMDEPTNIDFDSNGLANCIDINMLSRAIVLGDLSFDIDDSGRMDSGDIERWLALAGARPEHSKATNGNPFFNGDANLDGVVDGLDFMLWLDHSFSSVNHEDSPDVLPNGYCDGDFNGDSIVDGRDFIIWNENKFNDSAFQNRIPLQKNPDGSVEILKRKVDTVSSHLRSESKHDGLPNNDSRFVDRGSENHPLVNLAHFSHHDSCFARKALACYAGSDPSVANHRGELETAWNDETEAD